MRLVLVLRAWQGKWVSFVGVGAADLFWFGVNTWVPHFSRVSSKGAPNHFGMEGGTP
jgi:hypothetical protein